MKHAKIGILIRLRIGIGLQKGHSFGLGIKASYTIGRIDAMAIEAHQSGFLDFVLK